jgi:hypothetical protein
MSPGRWRLGQAPRPGSWQPAAIGCSRSTSSDGSPGSGWGLEVDELDGGHMIAMSHPVELADRLEAVRREVLGAG